LGFISNVAAAFDVQNLNPCTRVFKKLYRRRADALRAAGDDGELSGEIEEKMESVPDFFG